MRRLAVTITAGLLLAIALAGTAHADPFLDTERTECEAGVAQLQNEWAHTRLVTVPVLCRKVEPGSLKAGEYFDGYAFVLYGNGDRPVSEYRDIAAHELGHAWEDLRLSDARQTRYDQLRGLTPGSIAAAEDYADVFAFLIGDVTRNAYGTRLPNVLEATVICSERLVPCQCRPDAEREERPGPKPRASHA